MGYAPVTYCRECSEPFDVYRAPEERLCEGCQEMSSQAGYIDIVFDGPPGPEAGRFVEVENAMGRSIRVGEWIERDDGLWALRLTAADMPVAAAG